eukprot:jgi/Chrpa1/20249/Chrysochromulina_OHIO_Genome00025198-RA
MSCICATAFRKSQYCGDAPLALTPQHVRAASANHHDRACNTLGVHAKLAMLPAVMRDSRSGL